MIGLEQTSITVSEDVGDIEICTSILSPDLPCPVEFPFDVTFSTVSGTASTIIC